MNSSEKNYHFK